MLDRRDRFRGCLLGQCLGDAIGFPVEGHGPDVCAPWVAGFDANRAPPAVGRPPFRFGQYSDDSQLARELCESFVEVGHFDPAAYARRIERIFAEGRIVGRGAATEQAAERLSAGVPWDRAGTPPPSAGNGSAMRAGPVGLFAPDDAALVRDAVRQGCMTHLDPRASAGAVAIAGAVRLVRTVDRVDVPSFVTTLSGWARTVDGSVADALGALPALLQDAPDRAVVRVAALGATGESDVRWRGISPFVTPSVVWSLYCFLRTPNDYVETIRTAVAAGGDVDTTAAMAGAISGAFVGLSGLPPAWVRTVHDRATWGFADLVALADGVYDIATG